MEFHICIHSLVFSKVSRTALCKLPKFFFFNQNSSHLNLFDLQLLSAELIITAMLCLSFLSMHYASEINSRQKAGLIFSVSLLSGIIILHCPLCSVCKKLFSSCLLGGQIWYKLRHWGNKIKSHLVVSVSRFFF